MMTPKQWCVANRQWGKRLNTAHAKRMLVEYQDNFWRKVLKLYGVRA